MLPVPTMPMPSGSTVGAYAIVVWSRHATRPDRTPALHGPGARRHAPRRCRRRLSIGRAGGSARHATARARATPDRDRIATDRVARKHRAAAYGPDRGR